MSFLCAILVYSWQIDFHIDFGLVPIICTFHQTTCRSPIFCKITHSVTAVTLDKLHGLEVLEKHLDVVSEVSWKFESSFLSYLRYLILLPLDIFYLLSSASSP